VSRRPMFRPLLPIVLISILAFLSAGCVTDGIPVIGKDPASAEMGEGATAPPQPEWSYSGENGPGGWADLAPEWFIAREGKRQSPIDITEARLTGALFPIVLEYESSGVNLTNTGHGIEQTYFPGSHVNIGNQKFELKTFDFHSPSEHTIQGQKYPLEMQLVHEGPIGQLLIISVLFEEGPSNAFLSTLWPHLPTSPKTTTEKADALINAAQALPLDKSYYFYEGSLSQPPCTEGVQWYILRQPAKLSADQLSAFTKLYSGNVRPVQPLNERRVWMTN